jgi:hypothetical protein
LSGFVYLWYDRKNKRFYLGSHWGKEDDGYICSSNWMYNTYKRHPEHFKRRIIARITSSRRDLMFEELRWLYMISESEIKTKYYNLNVRGTGHWSLDEDQRKTVSQKMRQSIIDKFAQDPSYKEKIRQAAIKQKEDPIYRQKQLDGIRAKVQDPDYREKRRQSANRQWQDPAFQETIRKSRAKTHSDPEFRKRMSKTKMGQKHTEETKQKMKGRIPWNKGTKGVMKAWNKGKSLNTKSI